MSQSLTCNYIHIVFSTKYRKQLIDDVISEELYSYIGGICKNLECYPLQVGGYTNHIHALCNLSKKIPLMKLLEEMKKSSSKWIKTRGDRYKDFYWQNGYGAFSVSPSHTDVVIHYIKNQVQHHKRETFENELLDFLRKYHLEYDERYIWD
jgi:putative transposase